MEENKKSKKWLIITILIVVIVALAGVGGYFGYKISQDNQTTGTDWGDTYLDDLVDKISNWEYVDAENASFGFFQFEESKQPSMVLNYETETDKVMEISVLDSENNIKLGKFTTEKENELNIEMLYDIEKKEYNWYRVVKRQDGTEVYTETSQDDIGDGIIVSADQFYTFTKEEMTEQEVSEGEIPSISKFAEKFIKPDIKSNRTDIDLKNKNIDKKEVKEKVEKAVESYKPYNENVSEEVKQEVENSLNELETKKEEIKKAEEEKTKKEAEEKAKAEEEAKKKAEEEAKKQTNDVIKIGKYTLKYGSYKGYGPYIAGDMFTIKRDNTYEIKMTNGHTSHGTWAVISPENGTELSLDGDQWSMPILGNDHLGTLDNNGSGYKWVSE